MAGRFAIIGLGQFGYAVASKLTQKGAEVLAIDRDIERIEMIKDEVAYAVAMDSTDMKALLAQNVTDMDAVLIAIGENIEGLLLTTVHLLELKVRRIIARAMSVQQRVILNKLGVKEILSPEHEAANRISELLINPEMRAFLSLPDDHEIVELAAPRRIMQKSLEEIELFDKYNLKLITIKRYYEEYNLGQKRFIPHLIRNIKRDIIIQPMDMLFVLGKSEDISRFIEINK